MKSQTEAVKLLQEVGTYSRSLAHTFVRDIAHGDYSLEEIERLMEGLDELAGMVNRLRFHTAVLSIPDTEKRILEFLDMVKDDDVPPLPAKYSPAGIMKLIKEQLK